MEIGRDESLELKVENLISLKVTDLKRELKARGLSVTGNKTELIQRLQSSLINGSKSIDSLESAEDINEDDVLADDSILNDEVKTNDISEDDILDSKDIENVSVKSVGKIEKIKPKKITEKVKISISRNTTPIVVDNVVKQTESQLPKITDEPNKPKKITIEPSKETEKLTLRAKRFGVISEDSKLKGRAERFGTLKQSNGTTGSVNKTSPIDKTTPVDVGRLKQRAERFGQVISPVIKTEEEKDRLLKRKQRFGTVLPSVTLVGEDDRKKKRLERFQGK